MAAPDNAPVHLVFFGDSLSDSGMNLPHEDKGNNLWARTQGKTGAPIVNPDVSTGTHPLWTNWLTRRLAPSDTLTPLRVATAHQLDPAGQSLNYAFAAAETGNHYLNDLSSEIFPPYVDAICQAPGKISDTAACVPGVLKQIQLYLAAVPHPASDTRFILWAGGNDIFNNVKKTQYLFSKKEVSDISTWLRAQFMPTLFPQHTPSPRPEFPVFSDPVANLLIAKNKLIAAGVKPEQIYVINLPDLSLSPAGIRLANGNPAILQTIHLLSIGFNESLTLMLAHNPLSDNNLADSHVLSIYDFLNEVMAHPADFQITNLTGNCVEDNQTPLCTGYVFFNEKHPTAETGKYIAEWVEKQITDKKSK